MDVDPARLVHVNVSDRRINLLSRNDAKSMREAAHAFALHRWLVSHGSRTAL